MLRYQLRSHPGAGVLLVEPGRGSQREGESELRKSRWRAVPFFYDGHKGFK